MTLLSTEYIQAVIMIKQSLFTHRLKMSAFEYILNCKKSVKIKHIKNGILQMIYHKAIILSKRPKNKLYIIMF